MKKLVLGKGVWRNSADRWCRKDEEGDGEGGGGLVDVEEEVRFCAPPCGVSSDEAKRTRGDERNGVWNRMGIGESDISEERMRTEEDEERGRGDRRKEVREGQKKEETINIEEKECRNFGRL